MRALAAATAVFLAACGGEQAPPPGEAPPNMLLFIVDTLRADSLTPYGAAAEATPHIAAFAAESVVFEEAYAPSSWTRASVASLLSSLHPGSHAAEDRADPLSERITLLSEVVKEHGYRTGFITTNPNTGRLFGFAQGFDEMVELYDHQPGEKIRPAAMKASAEDVAREVVRFFEAGPEPFLLVVLSIDPHSPYAPPERFDRAAGTIASEARGNGAWINRKDLRPEDRARIRSLYEGEVAYSDHGFGLVREAMKRSGLDARTITVLTSDHGEAFWEHGRRGHGKSLAEETIRVPLVIHHPAKRPGDQRIRGGVETLDIAPTLLALAGLPVPEAFAGRSLFERGGPVEPSEEPRTIFSRLTLEDRDLASIRKGAWKLVWDLESDTRQLFDLAGAGESEDLAAREPDRADALLRELENHLVGVRYQRDKLLGNTEPGVVTPQDLPEEQRRLLIELGYLEPGLEPDLEPGLEPGEQEETANGED